MISLSNRPRRIRSFILNGGNLARHVHIWALLLRRGAMTEQPIMRFERQRLDLVRSQVTLCSVNVLSYCCSGDLAPLRRRSAGRRTRREREPQGANDAHDGAEFGISSLPQRLVEAFAIQAGLLRNTSHAARACNKAKHVAHEIRVTGFKRCRNVGNLPLFSVKMVDGIKSRAADASCASRREGPDHFAAKRPPAVLLAALSITAAKLSKNRHLRNCFLGSLDFRLLQKNLSQET
jgi:hypothetical protein